MNILYKIFKKNKNGVICKKGRGVIYRGGIIPPSQFRLYVKTSQFVSSKIYDKPFSPQDHMLHVVDNHAEALLIKYTN